MRMRASLGVVMTGLLLSACQQAASPPSTSVRPTQSTVSTPRPTPTPVPTPTPPPALAVENVGATASPSGFLAFVVVSNPSGETAMDVQIDVTAANVSGQPLAHRSGSIHRIGSGQREAVAVAFPAGRLLPARFSGSVTSVRWVSADASTDPAQVAGASFVQDARTPSVRVHVVNHAQGADRVAVTAVCWDQAGNIRGGGSRTLMVGPQAQGQDVWIQVAISAVPARCDAYALTSS